jgi:hypothetical protein
LFDLAPPRQATAREGAAKFDGPTRAEKRYAPTSAELAAPRRPVLIAQWKASHRKIEQAFSTSIEYFLENLEASLNRKESQHEEICVA